jgi:isopenicillin N synthase-like dioxygenase
VKVNGEFTKIQNDLDVMLFQVGEFGQLVADDKITATEHRVHKANSPQVERYAMALFFDAPMDTVIHSTSVLTEDSRYGGSSGDSCSYQHWTEESFKRYIVE